MFGLTRKTDYALVALAGLAAEIDKAASSHELSERMNLPLPVLRNILKVMTQHGILKSVQGTHGGYQLARDPDRISIAEVITAVEGPPRLAMCCSGATSPGESGCHLEDSCKIKASIQTVHRNLLTYLSRVTLAELANGNIKPALDIAGRAACKPDFATRITSLETMAGIGSL